MEAEIFYWTGVVVWWGVCLMVMSGVAVMVIITPLYAFKRSRGGWWRWFTLAKFVELGWTHKELNHIAAMVGGADDEFLRKAAKAVEVARDMRSSVDTVIKSKKLVEP